MRPWSVMPIPFKKKSITQRKMDRNNRTSGGACCQLCLSPPSSREEIISAIAPMRMNPTQKSNLLIFVRLNLSQKPFRFFYRCGKFRGIVRRMTIKATAATGGLIRNTHLQVVRLFISPPTSGPVNMAMAPTAASQRYVIDGPAAKKHSSK